MFCSSAGVHEAIQRASDLPLILVVLFNAKVGFSESKTFCVIGKSFRTTYSVEEHMYYDTIIYDSDDFYTEIKFVEKSRSFLRSLAM